MTLDEQDSAIAGLALDIHDDLNPHLIIGKQKLSHAIHILKNSAGCNKNDEVLTLLRGVEEEIKGAYTSMRRIVSGQTPELLSIMGLAAACEDITRRAHAMQIQVFMNGQAYLNSVQKDRQLTVYRLFQETLNNVLKHSMAHSVWIDIELSKDGLRLRFADDGHGISDLSARMAHPLFMNSIKQRTKALGADLRVEGKASDHGGLEICVVLPKEVLSAMYQSL